MATTKDTLALIVDLWARLKGAEEEIENLTVISADEAEFFRQKTHELEQQVYAAKQEASSGKAERPAPSTPTEEMEKIQREYGLLKARFQEACNDRDAWAQKFQDLEWEIAKAKKAPETKAKRAKADKAEVSQ